MEQDKLLKLGTVAKIIGVSPQTIRNWEVTGVLLPTCITKGGHRLYSKVLIEAFLKKCDCA